VPDAPWQAWIDQPRDEPGTYQHAAGPGRWAVGGHVDPAETAWERGREAAVEASRRAALDYARRHLTVEPTIVDTLYCVTMPQHGDGAFFARNGPVVTLYGNNLMKLAPVLGSALATAAVDGSTPSVPELAAAL
jgi:sarcosine oxidase